MFSKKTVLSLVIMAATLFVGAIPAFATPPDCTSGRNLRGYNAGVTIGRSIVRQAWTSIDQDPDRFDELVDVVHDAVWVAIGALPNDASEYTKCRAKGLGQGVCDQLGDIQTVVIGQCVLDGEVWGELSAVLYCALSYELGPQEALGLIPVSPVGLCGLYFEDACQDEFGLVAAAEPTCGPFIAAPNDDVFADWQVGMCAYELP